MKYETPKIDDHGSLVQLTATGDNGGPWGGHYNPPGHSCPTGGHHGDGEHGDSQSSSFSGGDPRCDDYERDHDWNSGNQGNQGNNEGHHGSSYPGAAGAGNNPTYPTPSR